MNKKTNIKVNDHILIKNLKEGQNLSKKRRTKNTKKTKKTIQGNRPVDPGNQKINPNTHGKGETR